LRSAPSIRPAGAGGAAAGPVERPAREPRQRRPRRQVEAPPVATVDPRFSARRVAVRRDAGRRRLRKVAVLGVLVVLVAGAAGLTRTPLLDLDTIAVEGAATLGADQIRAVVADAGVRPGQPLLDLDAGRAEAALEALPGIEEAHVTRHWPGSITIEVVERVPVAAMTVAGGIALVGADGIVVDVQPGPSALVAVDGPSTLAPGDRVDATALLAVAAALPDSVRALVSGIGEAGDGGVELRLAAGGVARLGSADRLAEKLVALQTMLTEVDTTCLAILDLQVPSAPTIDRAPECGDAEATGDA
jgi:cell division protein FtsQ